MVIMSSTVQAGWHIDKDDDSIDNVSTGSTFSNNCNENLLKIDQDSSLYNNLKKATHNSTMTHTDEEGWTTASPGKKKPKKSNNKGSSTESIIMSIEGDIDMIDTKTQNKIYVTSPGRKHKCNIPDERRRTTESKQKSRAEGGEKGKEQSKEGTKEGEETTSKENKNGNNRNNSNEEGKKEIKKTTKKKEVKTTMEEEMAKMEEVEEEDEEVEEEEAAEEEEVEERKESKFQEQNGRHMNSQSVLTQRQ
jgi:hypothetical protein